MLLRCPISFEGGRAQAVEHLLAAARTDTGLNSSNFNDEIPQLNYKDAP
jgi:hypothetical protein